MKYLKKNKAEIKFAVQLIFIAAVSLVATLFIN